MSTNIYILKLQGGHYYVGKSDDPMKRYQEHLNGHGSAWTKKYKPISVEKIIGKASPFDEDRIVKEYMNKYGIEKVRGGAYVREVLPDFQVDALKSELWGSTDKCTTCGRKGHWSKDCYAKKDITGSKIVEQTEKINSIKKTIKQSTAFPGNKVQSTACFRCGRTGHYSSDCYASTNKYGDYIDSDNDSDESDDNIYDGIGFDSDDDSENNSDYFYDDSD